jgi:uncharacterized OsmC-like protein
MSNTAKIQTAMARAIKAISKKPSVGQASEVIHIEVGADGCCVARDGDISLTIDMSKPFGGSGTTPSPGFFVRASLGACLAQGYHIWAAVHGVPINRLSVEVHYDSDMRGNLGIDRNIPPSYTAVRYVVHIDSPAAREKVEELIDAADEMDSIRDVFARAIPLERVLKITDSQKSA